MIRNKDAFFHIINPSSKHRSEVKKLLDSHTHFSHHWVNRLGHPTHFETIVEWAVMEGYRNLAVWGGDGSFNRLLQALYDGKLLQKISVALVPFGTCNDFARKLSLNWNDMKIALERHTIKTKSVDIAVVKGEKLARVFINNAGFGRTADRMNEKKSSALKDILNFQAKNLSIETVTNKSREFQKIQSLLMIVFNAPFFSGGMHFSPDIEPDDGVLNAFSVPPQTTVALLMKFLRGRLGKPLGERLIDRFDGEKIKVESDTDLFIQVDGEPAFATPQRKISFELLPQKIRLLIKE